VNRKKLIKMDYNDLIQQIDNVLSKSRSKIVVENAFGIATGLELLSVYLRKIAERAIELDDKVLLELLESLCVVKEE